MAWPSEAGAIASGTAAGGIIAPAVGDAVILHPAYRVPVFVYLTTDELERPQIGFAEMVGRHEGRQKYYHTARGKYRVFNAAEYRFYWSTTDPPDEGATPDATNSSLPYTTSDTFTDGIYYLSVSYFNGVIDSGFLPLGPNQEKYLRLDLTSGTELDGPPNKPSSVLLEPKASGVVRVVSFYAQTGSLRAEEWAVYYTFDGTDPGSGPTDSPDYTETMSTSGLVTLLKDLTGQAHGTTVKVRVQTRRNDEGTYRYSETDSDDINSETADATGPAAVPASEKWPGRLPEDL